MKTMNKELGIKILTTGLLCAFLYSLLFIIYSPLVLAQDSTQGTEYKLLAPIPLGKKLDSVSNSANTSNYLQSLVRLAIAIAGAAAVLRIIWAGTQYMTSDAFGVKSDAKNTIQNALYGLLLAVSAYLILATVNPKLVNISLDIPGQTIAPTTIPSGSGVDGTGNNQTNTDPTRLTTAQVNAKIRGTGVSITTGIRLEGVRAGVLDEVIALKRDCGASCNVTITSTTGGDHATTGTCNHGNGYKVDLRSRDNPALNNYIMKYRELPPRNNGDRVFSAPSGALYVLETDPPHWDVSKCN